MLTIQKNWELSEEFNIYYTSHHDELDKLSVACKIARYFLSIIIFRYLCTKLFYSIYYILYESIKKIQKNIFHRSVG